MTNETIRTLCLIDATMSMGHLLDVAKKTVATMFERALDILRNHKKSVNLEMQFAVYRDYDLPAEDLLQNSSWSSDPQDLKNFLNTIKPKTGYRGATWAEAVEIGLWHANQENSKHPIKQVILIGDAPPKSVDEIKVSRGILGEKYWNSTIFKTVTHYKDEIKILSSAGVKVHAFYVGSNEADVVSSFNEIASTTKGSCQALSGANQAQILTDLVTPELLKASASSEKEAAVFSEEYHNRFVRGYAN